MRFPFVRSSSQKTRIWSTHRAPLLTHGFDKRRQKSLKLRGDDDRCIARACDTRPLRRNRFDVGNRIGARRRHPMDFKSIQPSRFQAAGSPSGLNRGLQSDQDAMAADLKIARERKEHSGPFVQQRRKRPRRTIVSIKAARAEKFKYCNAQETIAPRIPKSDP